MLVGRLASKGVMKKLMMMFCIATMAMGALAARSVSQVTTYDDVKPKSAAVTIGAGTEGVTNVLAVCWGDKDYGETFADWPNHEYVAKLDAAATVYDYTYPAAIADNWKGSVKAVRFFVLEGDLTPPPSSAYVGDDALWMQLDGIDNAGLGLHSDTTNRWTDLCGHVDWSWAACCAWTNNAMVFTPSGSVRMTPAYRNGAKYADFGNVRTMEIVYKPRVMQGIPFTSGYSNTYRAQLGSKGIGVYKGGQGVSIDTTRAWYVAGTYNELVTGTFSGEVYRNGELVTSLISIGEDWNSTSAPGLGNRGDGGGTGAGSRADGTLYALRLYTRKLTAEEIAQNYAIDAARYELGGIYITDPVAVGSDVFLPEKLALTVDYAASPVGRGTVTASAETFREDDVVTFTAEAATGSSFVRWDGNLIPSGQATQNPLVLTLKESGTVTAVFGTKYLVSEDGDDDNNDGRTAPFATVGKAMSVAQPNDLISIGAGTYPLTAEVMLDKAITVEGAGTNATFLTMGATGIRAFTLSDASAAVRNLTISKFVAKLHGGAISMSRGLVENCLITGCGPDGLAGPCGGGINMSGGTVRNCTIEKCDVDACSSVRYGGGVYMTGGRVEDTLFVGNVATMENTNGRGSALYVKNGTVVRCRFVGNQNYDGNENGAALYDDGGSVIDRCWFEGNGPSAVRLSTGTLRNSVIVGGSNYQAFTAGATLAGNGKLFNCTFAGNVARMDATGCSALSMTSGTAVNNVFFGNGNGNGGEVVSGGTFNTNIVENAVSRGAGNLIVDSQFADAANGDYRLVFGSAAIDAGAALAEVTEDYAGVARPQGAVSDLGAYEYVDDGTFKVGVRFSDANVPEGGSVTAMAVVNGEATAYAWYLNGLLVAGETEPSVTFADLPAGKAAVMVVVTDGKGATHEKTIAEAFEAHPLKTYVATDGGNEYPYNQPEKAARMIADALAAVWKAADVTGEVAVAAGEYPISAAISLAQPVKISGAGREVTTVSQAASGDRAFNLSADGAEISGLRITGFKNALHGGAISMSKGLVRDCIIEKAVHSGREQRGGGIDMTGGTLLRCLISENSLASLGGYRRGAGVYMTNGLVEDCDFVNNTTGSANNNDQGEGVMMDGGTVRNCRFRDNHGAAGQTCSAAVYMTGASALVENCVITNNHPLGVRATKGVIRNSIIANNTGTSTVAAGACIDGGTMLHCTVYGNVASEDATGWSGLSMTSGTAVNNIFWENGGTLGGVKVTGGTFNTNIVDNAVDYGTFNRNVDPKLDGASTNDFRLVFGSPAIDVGATIEGIDADIVGTERPLGEGPDLGAYEYVPGADFTVGLQISPTECGVGDPVTLTAVVSGEAKAYAWFVDGVSVGTDAEVTLTDLGTGSHSFRLVVTDMTDREHVAEQTDGVTVRPLKTYVATDGGDVFPYDEPAKAARTIADALAAVWKNAAVTTDVEIAAGAYGLTEQLAISAPVRMKFDGRETTVVTQAVANIRAFNISSPGADVSGVTVTGFKNNLNGGALLMSAGTFRDSTIEKTSHTGSDQTGGGIYMTGGNLLRCNVNGNSLAGLGGPRLGSGIYMKDGTVEDCDIWDNTSGHSSTGNDRGEGVYVDGGTVRNCKVHGNRGSDDETVSAGVYVAGNGALVENCEIWGNRPLGLRIDNVASTVRNCLIHSNSNAVGIATGVAMLGGSLFNCTIVGNGDSSDALPSGLRMSKGTAVNNIIWGNGTNFLATGSASVTGGTFSTNLVDVAVDFGTGNMAEDPCFRHPERGDYTLSTASPCINKGRNMDWMINATDLVGNPRIHGRKPVDLGCCESLGNGQTVLLVR